MQYLNISKYALVKRVIFKRHVGYLLHIVSRDTLTEALNTYAFLKYTMCLIKLFNGTATFFLKIHIQWFIYV